MLRPTTNGVLKSYRYHLRLSGNTMNKSRETVLTQRNFNHFAEDPAAAARCFQLRRSFLRADSQHAVGQSVCQKYDVAWHTMQSVIDDVNNRTGDSAYAEIIHGQSDPTASGRQALGASLEKLAEGIVQTMNARYGSNFVFSGADGLNIPFQLDEDLNLSYRGIPVDSQIPSVELGTDQQPKAYNEQGAELDLTVPGVTQDPEKIYYKLNETGENGETMITKAAYDEQKKNVEALEYMAKDEHKFADLGLGLQEDENGNLIEDSAFDTALQGINFLGYGVDEDGDPKNMVSLLREMSSILKNCDADSGEFKPGEREKLDRLAGKFEAVASDMTRQHTELDTRKKFLDSNQALLKQNSFTLQEQFLGMEDADMAQAISAFVWAKYCYDSSLKVGNSILSQSLMDYLNT